MFCEYDVVALIRDLPEAGLTADSTGTIVHVFREGAAYEVEFTGGDVHTSVLVTLKHDQLQFVWSEGMGLRRG